MGKSTLLTGITGFAGSHIAECLIQNKFQLITTVRKSSDLTFVKQLGVPFWQIDWDDIDVITRQIQNVDYIIHCAGAIKAVDYQSYHKANVLPTKALLTAAKKKNTPLKRFILISTQAAAGPSKNNIPIDESSPCYPVTDYGKTKLEAENLVLDHKNHFPVTILRPCSIYGPRDHEFYPLFKLVKRHLSLFIGDGNNVINMIHAKDFAKAVLTSLEINHPSGSIYFVTDGNPYSWKDVFQTAGEVFQKKTFQINLPLIIPKIIGQFNEWRSSITKKPYLLNKQKINEIIPQFWICSSQKISNELGFNARYNLMDGFKETLQWYIHQKWL